jgi:ABC-type phosphate transport system substrate-binding protein
VRIRRWLLCWGALALGCGGERALVRMDGSSTVFPIAEAVAEAFAQERAGPQVIVGVSGTSGGFKKLCAGELDMAGASRPIAASEVELCSQHRIESVELPVAYDGIAIVVHPRNDWAASITAAELKQLWEPQAQGRVLRWNQLRPQWPDTEILQRGSELAREVGYVALPGRIYALAEQRLTERRTGSVFGDGGSPGGRSLDDLLQRESTAAARSSN